MKVHFISFGCKVNISEDESTARKLSEKGYEIISNEEEADIFIINTCAVTETAAKKCATSIKKIRKNNPNSILITTGCLVGVDGKTTETDAKTYAISNIDKDKIADLVCEIAPVSIFNVNKQNDKKHTRAFLKIEDGCDAFCSYCIIPTLRGAPKSKKMDEVLAEFKNLLSAGYKEIVLTGIHIGLYGRGESFSLADLLGELAKIEGKFRMRLSSIEINELTNELIEIIKKEDKICKHLHIPLQSGSDKILQLMNRKYLREDFISRVSLLKQNIANLTIGADVIVGFPSESSDDFNETIDTIKKSDVDFLHVFPYSKRVGTKAAEMSEQIGEETKESRANKLREIAKDKMDAIFEKNIGKVYEILTEKGNKGYTENYLQINITNKKIEPNEFIKVQITEVKNGKLLGMVL